MKLYYLTAYLTGACSPASNNALREAGLKFEPVKPWWASSIPSPTPGGARVDLGRWPELKRYVERIGQRPHVIAALLRGSSSSAAVRSRAIGGRRPSDCYHRRPWVRT